LGKEPVEFAAGGVEGALRKLSWKETAESFHTSWDNVCDAVEYVVAWGLKHRPLESIRAIGVDEIQYAKGHKYLTLVYQIDPGLTRRLWVGKERTIESFQGFFGGARKIVREEHKV
jgi:transposase